MTTEPRVLAVYGHPDDEGQAAGTLASFLAAGSAVTLVCATRGEVGEISEPELATPETLGYVRELELRAAMAQIGLADVRFLPYRDSGMVDTPENADPRCLHQQPDEVVVEALVRIIREVRPHLVFTWDPQGGYGHPDHIAVHKHMLTAFDAAADATAFPQAGAPWNPEALFWSARSMKAFAKIFLEMEQRGLLDEEIPADRRERFEKALAEPDPPVSVIVDTRAFRAARRRAASMHRTQFGPNSFFARLPDDLRDAFDGEERFYRARPAWPDGMPVQQGFDGITAAAAPTS